MKNSRTQNQPPIVLVDDEKSVLITAKAMLRTSGFAHVVTISDSTELLPFLEKEKAAVVVLDLMMPNVTGMELLPKIVSRFPHIPVLIMTASQELELAIKCMREGALDYMVKPVEESHFIANLHRAMDMNAMQQQVQQLKGALLAGKPKQEKIFAPIITRSPKMRAIFQYVEAIAPSQDPVMVSGETGVGKELLIQSIHDLSGCQGTLQAVNVAGLDDHLFTDTLFGHKKGAFSGADSARQGIVSKAEDGSLFLDEIGDLSPTSQVKLLRLLQEKTYQPLGSDITKTSNTRVLCATNHNLEKAVNEGKFRKDLYYRLHTHQIEIPPLRERREDIPLLLGAFLDESAKAIRKETPTPPPELLKLLHIHPFIGNVRELKSMVADAVAQHTSGILSMESFEKSILTKPIQETNGIEIQDNFILDTLPDPIPTLQNWSDLLIEEALKRAAGNQRIAAAMLGVSRHTIIRRKRNKQEKQGKKEP
ncbi:MAG: sigma-54-dependent Fis family transcriptional regulator [Magnetococcales bacterium]|nr:sigma-54-dependent Fis family transcriptional regulator [Magnetococcales bacterium]